MSIKYFNVKNGLSTGNILLHASNSNVVASTFTGNIVVTDSANLGAPGNITITGGSANYVLITDGAGNLSWAAQTGGDSSSYSNANVANYLPTYTGNLTANYFIGNGATLTNVTGANVTGYVPTATNANTVTTAAQPNITSLGTLTGLSIAGNIIPTSNVTYDLGNSDYRFRDLYLSGNTIQLGGGNISISGNSMVLTNPIGGQFIVDGAYSEYSGVANTVSTNAQPNITSVGTLIGLTSTGIINFSNTSNVTIGNVGNFHIPGGSADYVLTTNGSGVLSWSAPTTGSTTITVDSYTGNGVQVAFTLSTSPTNANYTVATIQGVVQPRSYYTVVGSTLTFSTAPPDTTIVEVTTFSSGGSGSSAGWTYSAISANTTAVAGYRYIVDTSIANLTITLPASGTLGDEVMIIDGTGNASTHAITVDKNGSKIQGANSNMTVTTDRAAFTLVYYNSTQGWILTNV